MEKYKTIHENRVMINPPEVLKPVLVIYEQDKVDNSSCVIGVTTSKENAIKLIKEYYGENEIFTEPKMVEDSGIEFMMSVEVAGNWGGFYDITVFYFIPDEL